ncbi:hypothetical protein QR680_005829 [Steinernema hermaphroditum]|uniref:Uncharacterized protein n=1 Tax=Steinernema hermaphroditum TaxID=289476 RepID=A0AA39HVM8_9BILA|nr:hypothetical protein QR680_005829 [Steinernema hermaphroditum]
MSLEVTKQIQKNRRPPPRKSGKKKLENAGDHLAGLMFMAEGFENRARLEADKLLHRYFEEVESAEAEENDDVDAADALMAQSQSIMKERNWEWLETGAKNVLFCTVSGTDITKITEWLVTTCQAGNENRHLTRIYPSFVTSI